MAFRRPRNSWTCRMTSSSTRACRPPD
jgi:hypothetical protein